MRSRLEGYNDSSQEGTPGGSSSRDVASSNMTLYGPKQRSAFHLAAPAGGVSPGTTKEMTMPTTVPDLRRFKDEGQRFTSSKI